MLAVTLALFAAGDPAQAAIGDLDLTGFYEAGFTVSLGGLLKWFAIVLAAVGAGAAIYLSAGTLSPVVMGFGHSIGAVAGLHGATARPRRR